MWKVVRNFADAVRSSSLVRGWHGSQEDEIVFPMVSMAKNKWFSASRKF